MYYTYCGAAPWRQGRLAAAGRHHHAGGEEQGESRTELILRSCQERARDVLLDRALFSLTPEQSTALLGDLEDPVVAAQHQASIELRSGSGGLPIGGIPPLAAHRLDLDAAALRPIRLTGGRKLPTRRLPWLNPTSKRSWKKAATSRWGASACPVMLVRREGESFVALLRRLDRSIAKAWEQEITIDEVNG